MGRPLGLAGVLAAAFLLLHLPFIPTSLEDHDSINFALGMRHFDVAEHQPHPPGYPLLIASADVLRAVVPSEPFALSLLGIIAGALSVVALVAVFRRLDGAASAFWTAPAAVLAATSPLYWFTSARPLSDMPGLAAALGVQALTLSAASGTGLAAAAFLAGLATGIRSQVIWLTAPLLVVRLARSPRDERLEDFLVAAGALAIGGLVWFIPLVWATGGPMSYWRALSAQGSEDFSGVAMLWTSHSPKQLLLAFNSTFVAPWGSPVLAGVTIGLAAIGALRVLWASRPVALVLAAAFVPYVVFDLLFQETVTTRYALPVAVPLAYLAVRAAALLPRRAGLATIIVLVAANLALAVPNLQAYAGVDAPAFRLLKDMRLSSPTLGAPPVLATHRREELDLRRPITWMAEEMAVFSQRLPATPKHEWLELVKYWNAGGRAPVWFVADPLRSDLALVDHGPPRRYRWPLTFPILLGGVRPSEMDWYMLDSPGWYLGEGWALTPETAGVADTGGYGRRRGPSQGWMRRRLEPTTLMIGGRNFAGDGTDASIDISLDGRLVERRTVPPGFFMQISTVPAEALAGSGDYAALTIATRGDVAIEQFDAQPPDRVVFGYGEGWHEHEYDDSTGRLWRWMSERANLRVRATGQPLVLDMNGVTEGFSRPSHVTIRLGDRVIARQDVGPSFSIRADIPPDLVGDRADRVITIETDQVYVPADRKSGVTDRRHLGLKVFDCRISVRP